MRQMILVGFMQAQNCTNLASSWRHPASRTDTMSTEYYQDIAKILEAGKFHLAFFDDRLAMPSLYGNNHEHTVAHGIRCVKLDPTVVMMAMAAVTRRLGLAATYSTTYHRPFHVARLFATIDLLTNGRAAWNIVTSVNDEEARNMGASEVMAHDQRYDQADEFMDVVVGHWNSWEDDALIIDKEAGLYADPKKVHRIQHKGRFFSSQGPFTVPRSAQGQPVLLQAGSSGRGSAFSARWAEVVFAVHQTLELGRKTYARLKDGVAQAGRDPADVKLASMAYIVTAATKMEAEDKWAEIERLPNDDEALSLLSEALNFDFATKALDEAFTDQELANISGIQAIRDRVLNGSGKSNPTVSDFIRHSGRGRPLNPFVGGPKDVADGLEEWFTTGACDGFVIAATHVPGTYEDVVRHVVPELQRRKLFHNDYSGTTLRENLGLGRPLQALNGTASE